ncbi:MAG: glycosyltransferase family 4 protein [Acidobacteria bacterium]|nr:glycosyltransferase family 4 protein [Acidobacteriota bacterium]
MRVLAFTTDAFGAKWGIAEYNRNFLTALCKDSRCNEVVVIPRHAPDDPGQLHDKIRFVTASLNGKSNYAKTAIWESVFGQKFDLVICGHINLLPFAWLASRRHGAKLVLVIHGIDAWQPHRSKLINALVKQVKAVISVSHLSLERFLGWAIPERNRQRLSMSIIPNTIDLTRYMPGTKPVALLDKYGLAGKKVLLTMGRLAAHERYKGVDEVLELLPGLRKKIPELVYLIIGDGNDRQRLEEKTERLGLTKCVVFAGYIPNEEKQEHYHLADVYVMPSRGEGFGIVFLEAMASGIPVVASKLDGGREAVREGLLGILVDPNCKEEIEEGILSALSQSCGIVPAGLDYFSLNQFEDRVHQLLDTLTNTQAPQFDPSPFRSLQ